MTPGTPTLKDRIISTFQMIHEERMAGIPILNSKLDVDAVGFERFEDHFVGILVTPWFMNLMLLPVQDPPSDGAVSVNQPQIGSNINVSLPAGRFEFIAGYEDALGPFMSCSLFSPMFEFADQETAMITAQSAYSEVMTPPQDETEAETKEAAPKPAAPPKEFSRRNLLRGKPRENVKNS